MHESEKERYYLFDVEASNENLDLEQQRVLQRALLDSKDYFLTNGVVSKDHLHKRYENEREITDEEYIIGEPVEVYTDGRSTRVKGKLYERNPHARKFIELLKAGSTRVKASVGGILPKITRSAKDGTEKIVSFLWNDLALTVAPVNYTVSPAYGVVKSLTGPEFVKSLSAGYGTNSAEFAGGRALIPEDVESRTDDDSAIADLLRAIKAGNVKNNDEAREFLENRGFSEDEAVICTAEIRREAMEVLA